MENIIFEPLKDKKRTHDCYDGLIFNYFKPMDVRFAVDGLKHDIKHSKELYIFPEAGRKALELINKWFPDVIE